jgi:hypothetical protein
VGVFNGWTHGGERKREEMCRNQKKLVFWLTLDLIFFSFGAWNPFLFIGGGSGQSCLQWGEIAALDSVGKDLNRWFKVGILSCQICRERLTKLASLGRRRHRWVVIQPEWALRGCREIAEDHLRARFVNFDER